MQFFGIGILELMVIMILTVIVVGPDRLPQVAADLAQWIRKARAYATHISKDFNDVVGELEKEVGANREDWKEIANLVTRQGSSVGGAVTSAASALERSLDDKPAQSATPPPPEATPLAEASTASANGNGVHAEDSETPSEEEPEAEKAWYETDRPVRRRSRTS